MPNRSEQLVVGIDGGGTKSQALLCRREPNGSLTVLSSAVTGPSNLQAHGFEACIRELIQSVNQCRIAANRSESPINAMCCALSGAGRSDEQQRVKDRICDAFRLQSCQVTHDAEPVLRAGTANGTGIAVIAGTGSFAFARYSDGHTRRLGGLGYLLGDEGSGYWIAHRGLSAVAAEIDGQEPNSGLSDLLLDSMAVTPAEFVPAVYANYADRTAMASLAPVIIHAAQERIAPALRITQEAIDSLTSLVQTLHSDTRSDSGREYVALAGGLLVESKWYCEQLTQSLESLSGVEFTITTVDSPAIGAAQLAADRLEEI